MSEVTTTREQSKVVVGDALVVEPSGFDEMIVALNVDYDVRGPVVRDGAIVTGALGRAHDLPVAIHDRQEPGRYRLVEGDDEEWFGWAVGPTSWKPELYPPSQVLWRSEGRGDRLKFVTPHDDLRALALVGVRPCDVAALRVLERVFLGRHPNPTFARSRRNLFVVAVECARPASTCFCASMGAGPGLDGDVDLAVTELFSPHRFLVRVCSVRGAEVASTVTHAGAGADDWASREAALASATEQLSRRVDYDGIATLLARSIEHPHWDAVAERCLSCANCTMVCPTCFCGDVRDVTDLAGDTRRQHSWSSCFDLEHSFVHGGPVRPGAPARYRQWLTHKFSTWWDQFGSSGCVGCGRCITWCPVGIDVTAELDAFTPPSSPTIDPEEAPA